MSRPDQPFPIFLDTTYQLDIVPDKEGKPEVLWYDSHLGSFAFQARPPSERVSHSSTSVFKDNIAIAQFDDQNGNLLAAGVWIVNRALQLPHAYYESHPSVLEKVREVQKLGELAVVIDMGAHTIEVVRNGEKDNLEVLESRELVSEHESFYERYWFGYFDTIPFPIGAFQYEDTALVGVTFDEKAEMLLGEEFSRQARLSHLFQAPEKPIVEKAIHTIFPSLKSK